MGLNLRNESDNVTHMSKEIRYRVWWSLYALDVSILSMNGRPAKCIPDAQSSTRATKSILGLSYFSMVVHFTLRYAIDYCPLDRILHQG